MDNLQRTRDDGSDDSESFYSAEELESNSRDVSDHESFYSADDLSSDQDMVSVEDFLVHDEMDMNADVTQPVEYSQDDYTINEMNEYDATSGYGTSDEREVFNFYNHAEQPICLPGETMIKNDKPDILTLEIDSGSDSDIYHEKPDVYRRSPSVKVMSQVENTQPFLGSPRDGEITVPDVISLVGEPFVEFDGTRQVIVIDSEDEEEPDYMRKRYKSPDIDDEAPDADLQQSPYQRKMKKLKEIADRANQFSNKVDDGPLRVMER